MPAWILTNADGSHMWAGPGLVPIGSCLDLTSRRRLPLFATREAAQRAADALLKVWRLNLRPLKIRCLGER